MISVIINIIKIIFLLGFLIFIHESGHFLTAKICKVKVNEFSIGFGPKILKWQRKETQYAIRLIPLGGFVSMEGENEKSQDERSFSNASIPKRIVIVAAGAIINILFGIFIFFLLFAILYQDIGVGISATGSFCGSLFESIKMLFTGQVGVNDFTGPVGISQMITQTADFANYIYLMSVVSVSLGITNLLPFPALDGGKIVLLIIETIRKKALSQETEIKINLIGLSILITLSLIVTFNDVARIVK